MVHNSPYKSSVKWQRCTLGNSSCCDQTELPSSATSTSPGLVCWNYMKLHYMKYGKYGSGQFLRKCRLSSEPSPERCRTLPSESSSFAKLRPFSMLLMSLCCESKAPVAFQHKNPIDGKTQHQFQQIHGVEAIVHLVKKKNATGRFTLRLHPIPMAQHPQAVTQWHDPSTLTRVFGTLPFEFYNVLSPLSSIFLFHFFLFHRQLLKDMVKTHALVHVAIGKTSAFPPDSHFFRSFAGHIEPLPQRPIFQVLLFFL